MTNLSFEGVKKLVETQGDNTDSYVLQVVGVKNSPDTTKICQKVTLSCGNYSVLAVVPTTLKMQMQKNGAKAMMELHDIVKIKKTKLNNTNNRCIIILKEAYEILKTGVKTKIGNPTLVDDLKNSGNWPQADIKNTVFRQSLTSNEPEEYKKETANNSSPILRKSGVASKNADDTYTPINALNTMNPDWIICAKVTNKGAIRTYQNNKGEGKLFNFELADTYGSQIQATCFNAAAEKFEPMIEKGRIYKISKGDVKIANKRFCSIKNDY